MALCGSIRHLLAHWETARDPGRDSRDILAGKLIASGHSVSPYGTFLPAYSVPFLTIFCALFFFQNDPSKKIANSGIIPAQKLVSASGHVNVVWFTLAALTIQELIDMLICRGVFQVCRHHLEENFYQMRRSFL